MPSLREMEEWHARRVVWRDGVMREYGRKSTFFDMYLPFTDHVDWLDRTAGCGLREHFGIWERWINLCEYSCFFFFFLPFPKKPTHKTPPLSLFSLSLSLSSLFLILSYFSQPPGNSGIKTVNSTTPVVTD